MNCDNRSRVSAIANSAIEDLIARQGELARQRDSDAWKIGLLYGPGNPAGQLADFTAAEKLRNLPKQYEPPAMFLQMGDNYKTLIELSKTLTDSTSNMFEGWVLGTRTAAQAWQGMAASISASIMQMVAKMLLLKLVGSLIGMFTGTATNIGAGANVWGGEGGGIGAGAMGMHVPYIGGGHAAGGPVMPGTIYPVGENGPEWFMPATAGTIIPGHLILDPE